MGSRTAGFNQAATCKSASSNMCSAVDNAEVDSAMGRANFLRHSLTFWLEISIEDLLSGGGCTTMVDAMTRSDVGGTLPRRLHHYGPPSSAVCQNNLDVMLMLCRRLGVLVVPAKCEGPSTVLVYLGFELNTDNMVVRLPQAKLQCTLALVQEWVEREAAGNESWSPF